MGRKMNLLKKVCSGMLAIGMLNPWAWAEDVTFEVTFAGDAEPTAIHCDASDPWKCFSNQIGNRKNDITTATIPEVVTTIPKEMFSRWENLTSANGPGVTTIEVWAFSRCRSLKLINVPNVTTIGQQAFIGCKNLVSVTIPKGVTTIGSMAFFDCENLETVIFNQGEGVLVIGGSAFSGCQRLSRIDFSGRKVSLEGDYTFHGCHILQEQGFQNWENMTYSLSAFFGCPSLCRKFNHLNLDSLHEQSDETSISLEAWLPDGKNRLSFTVTLPPQDKTPIKWLILEKMLSDQNLVNTYTLLRQGVRLLESAGSEGLCCGTHTKHLAVVGPVIVKSKLEVLGKEAFSGCRNLTKVALPESITTIGENAFDYCTSLKSINIPNVTTIGSRAFEYCISLKLINAPNVTIIKDGAFYGCRSLVSINLPSASAIGDEAFYDCSELRTVAILGNNTVISKRAFQECPTLTLASMYPLAVDQQGHIHTLPSN